MKEPILRCRHRLPSGQLCRHVYPESDARRATKGRYLGRMIGPNHCGHPVAEAVYVDPATYRPLVPYSAAGQWQEAA